jgi:hypothetical protein
MIEKPAMIKYFNADSLELIPKGSNTSRKKNTNKLSTRDILITYPGSSRSG